MAASVQHLDEYSYSEPCEIFIVRSSSGDRRYQVSIGYDGSRRCACPGHFFHRTDCRYIKLVLEYMGLREQVEEVKEDYDGGRPQEVRVCRSSPLARAKRRRQA